MNEGSHIRNEKGIQAVLRTVNTIAVVGASSKPWRDSNSIMRYLRGDRKIAKLLCHMVAGWLLFASAHGQDSLSNIPALSDFPDSVFVVGKIMVTGNVHTKEFVITREMLLRPGSKITHRALEYDENRISSLGLFNRVQLRVLPFADSFAIVAVDVNERWYVFPFPIFGIKDRDWEKVYYGFGVLHDNFRGRNEKVYTTFVFGFDPSMRLTYRNPFLDEELSNFIEIGFGFNKVRNRSMRAEQGIANFDERHIGGGVTFGKRIGIAHTLWATGGYESVSTPDVTPAKTLSPDGTDNFPVGALGYSYDTRDFTEYPHYGSFARVTATKFGLPGLSHNVVRYAGDGRMFFPITSNLVLGGRLFTDLAAAGPTPSYNRVFFGYGQRLRGHFTEVMEGDDMLGASAELRFMALAPVYFRVGFLPSEFSIWRFGIAFTAFGDAGSVWFRRDPLALDQFSKGYGVGINVLLPYSTVIRIEYAWSESRRGEFIFDLGESF